MSQNWLLKIRDLVDMDIQYPQSGTVHRTFRELVIASASLGFVVHAGGHREKCQRSLLREMDVVDDLEKWFPLPRLLGCELNGGNTREGYARCSCYRLPPRNYYGVRKDGE